MKKFALVIALVVSLGLVGSLFASPASAFFFGGFGKKAGCGSGGYGTGYGMGYGMGYGYGASMCCAPMYCAPACDPMAGKAMKKGKKAKPKMK